MVASGAQEGCDNSTAIDRNATFCEKETNEHAPVTASIHGGASNFASTTMISSPPKNQKKPSGCLTGTPSSAQRPFKMRQSSTLDNVRHPEFCDAPQVKTTASTEASALELGRMFSEMLGDWPPLLDYHPLNHDNGSNSAGSIPPPAAHALPVTQTAEAFHMSITDEVKHARFKGFQFKIAVPVKNGAVPGYKYEFTVEEKMAREQIMKDSVWGIQNNRSKADVIDTDTGKTQKREITRGINGKMLGVEEVTRYYCKAPDCKCMMVIARILGGLLAYEKIDKEKNVPYQHTGHDIVKESLKTDQHSLTVAQKVYITTVGAMLLQKNGWIMMADAMISDPFVFVRDCQSQEIQTFADRIHFYVARERKKGYMQFVDKTMSGTQIQGIFNHLQSTNRAILPNDSSIPFLKSRDFGSLWNNIRVTDHNYEASGGVFDYICMEYTDASARAQMAIDAFGKDGVQGEMDFFHVPGVGADWQVGHIGFSDMKHRYFILGMIICRSENSRSAGLLLKQAINLIHNHGGKMACVLVDGGTALNKAIGDENMQNELLRQHSLQKRRCFAHIIRMVS